MLGSLRSPLASRLSHASSPTITASPFASTSRHVLPTRFASPGVQQVRFRAQLAPKRTKYRKSMKQMNISLPTGGSIKGTVLANGAFGLRTLASCRLAAGHLTACREAIKRKLKPVKGAELTLRVFPDIPVCVKGNEVRMGKGKGSFEFWACRVPAGRVLMEIGGGGIREEIAKQALRLAQIKLPVPTEFITAAAPPRLGNITSSTLEHPLKDVVTPSLTGSEIKIKASSAPTASVSIQGGLTDGKHRLRRRLGAKAFWTEDPLLPAKGTTSRLALPKKKVDPSLLGKIEDSALATPVAL